LVYADQACLGPATSSFCVKNFTFFGVVEQEGLDDLDGILGLSPDYSSNGPSYISKLKESGLIDQKIASFFIGHLG